jgi:hypothetical protein
MSCSHSNSQPVENTVLTAITSACNETTVPVRFETALRYPLQKTWFIILRFIPVLIHIQTKKWQAKERKFPTIAWPVPSGHRYFPSHTVGSENNQSETTELHSRYALHI